MKIFLIPSQYILEIKHFLANKYKKQMCYKESKSLFVLNFFLKGWSFSIRSQIHFNREMGNI